MSGDWKDLFGPELWKGVGKGLRGASEDWWAKYRDDLMEYGEDELKDVLKALHEGGTVEAKMEIASRMSREEFVAYRDGVTDQLRGIAIRRAAILDAIEDLGRRSARLIGRAAAAALGF